MLCGELTRISCANNNDFDWTRLVNAKVWQLILAAGRISRLAIHGERSGHRENQKRKSPEKCPSLNKGLITEVNHSANQNS